MNSSKSGEEFDGMDKAAPARSSVVRAVVREKNVPSV